MLKQAINASVAESIFTAMRSLNPSEDIVQRWPAEALLQSNLQALRRRDAELAQRIGQVVLPVETSGQNFSSEAVRMVAARDGSVTFRLRGEEGRWRWLGYSSTPIISARANVKRIQVEQGNLAMNGIGHGAEAEGVLEVLGGHQALLVTENRMLFLNLALRLRDFTAALASGRLVFITDDDIVEGLVQFYHRHPGYNLITQCVAWPWRTEAENFAYHRLINQAVDLSAARVQEAANRLYVQLQAEDQRRPWSEVESALSPEKNSLSELRAINISYLNSIEHYCRSRDALAGLTQSGAQCQWQMSNRPDVVSPCAQMQRLVEQKPHLILLIDALRGHIKGALPEKVIVATLVTGRPWQDGAATAAMMGPRDAIFTATRQQRDELVAAGLSPERVFHLLLAADTQRYHPLEIAEKPQEFAVDVALVSDRPGTKPEDYQVNLPTHQTLWRQLISDLRSQPENYSPEQADALIRRAQRCGVELRQEDLQRFYRDMLNNVLAEAVLPEAYGMALVREKINFGIWYNEPLRKPAAQTRLHFWDESPLADCLKGAIDHGEKRNLLFNTARILLYIHPRGRVERLLLDAAASGAMLLVRSSRDDRRPDGLGDYFTPGEDIVTFDTTADLVRKVRYYLSHETQRQKMAQKTRQTVLSRHSCQLRMREMIDRLMMPS